MSFPTYTLTFFVAPGLMFTLWVLVKVIVSFRVIVYLSLTLVIVLCDVFLKVR